MNLDDIAKRRRRIYLARHATVQYFRDDASPIRDEDIILDANGRQQAADLAAALRPLELDRVVASSLGRAVETATAVAEPRAIQVKAFDALREVRPGKLAELPEREISKTFVDSLRGDLKPSDRFLGGEAFGEVYERANACVDDLLADTSWRDLLIVAHGGVNRMILARCLGGDLAIGGKIEQDAACLNIVDIDPDGTTIVRLVNFTTYLTLKDGSRLTTMESILGDLVARRTRSSS
ncbi:MAG: histidine phosphatase family protein [Planctomycetota bacterium]